MVVNLVVMVTLVVVMRRSVSNFCVVMRSGGGKCGGNVVVVMRQGGGNFGCDGDFGGGDEKWR